MSNRFIYEQPWTDTGKVTEKDFSQLYLSKPDKIGPSITFLMGKDNLNMNILQNMTDAVKNTQGIDGLDYEYDVMETLDKTIALAEDVNLDKAGVGFTSFQLKFRDRYFARDYTIFSPNKYRLRVTRDPWQEGSLWIYEVQQMGVTSPTTYVPASELKAGTNFARGYAVVSNFESVGNESNITAPAKIRGNISVIRKSFKWSGNIPNKMMTVEFMGNKMFWPFQQWQIERQWQEEVENILWYGKSNRADDGTFNQKDDNGNQIIEGDGLFEQIGNKDTYGVLSYNKLNTVISDMYMGMKDAQRKRIKLMTGIGGAIFFDQAMKSGALGTGFTQIAGDKFIQGEGHKLRLTGYFSEYEHIEGFTISVHVVDLFDFGNIARNTPLHPTTKKPLESHRMVFLDDSYYEGAPNIMGLYEKGRQFSRTAVLGVGPVPPGFPDTPNRASDKDTASIHYMKSCGVVLRRYNTSLDLQCRIA